ncbi:MAG: hemerythrin domain-containing protein [Ahrensia sp.]|nr:hemerythrin domain-containing protein [Ahrensia sp.]
MMTDVPNDHLSIEKRSGLPEEWRFLLLSYPRSDWLSHASLGEHTKFWLQVHRSFRMMGAHLNERTDAYESGIVTAEQFRHTMVRRLQNFLGSLDHHHRIEDHVFFPKFMEAEKRLVAGIELLEADHTVIDAQVHAMVDVANALLRSPASDKDALKRNGEDFAIASRRIVKLLDRHLDDEEEIVIPLLLDRGEEELMT